MLTSTKKLLLFLDICPAPQSRAPIQQRKLFPAMPFHTHARSPSKQPNPLLEAQLPLKLANSPPLSPLPDQ